MTTESSDQARTISWQKKLLFATVTTAIFFLLLEGSLALLRVERVTDSGDPFVGFSSRVPLLESKPAGNGESIMRTLVELNRRDGLTIVMVTHDPWIAQQADRTVQLVEGRIAAP